jgi:hypothetical protein
VKTIKDCLSRHYGYFMPNRSGGRAKARGTVREPDRRSDGEALKSKLNADRSFNGGNIFPVQAADPLPQAKLADRTQLIRHCLALLSPEPDIGFGR